ncbi:MAG: DUF4388 domain-containing protein [Meiothermus sp.]|nr:DUF4388 domain-containing protein [Meiothermus sp.]
MEGNFELISPIELLQLLAQARQSGAFGVPGGQIYIERGQPVHAQYKEARGREALFEMLALRDGQFRFLKGERATQTTLEGSLDNYLLEAIRFLDTRLDLSPFDEVELLDHERMGRITLDADEISLIKHLARPMSLLELSERCGLGVDAIGLHISHLARLSLVQINARTPRTVRLRIERLEKARGTVVQVDTHLLRVWRGQYGAFGNLEVKDGERYLQVAIEPRSQLGKALMLSADALRHYGLKPGQEVVAWPSL